MLITNAHPNYGRPLDPRDADCLSSENGAIVERFLKHRPGHAPTPLIYLPALARTLGVATLAVKDEGQRLGLGSFKALGGAYAVMRLVLELAEERLGRNLDVEALFSRPVQELAAGMTFGCATDGNHGRSVAQGAQLVGAQSRIFVHSGVSDERIAAIAAYGAEIIRVDGTYDDSVVEASRVCDTNGWTIVSDTSWPGYERIPSLVMQGYMPILHEALCQMSAAPTHVLIQAGVGGIAATLAGQLALRFGASRPRLIVVEPSRAACLLESALAGQPIKIAHGMPTVMAMLECYEPSLVAWRVLSRAADAFMTVEEEDAVEAMKQFARPHGDDPPLVVGESGGVGLAGLSRIAADPAARACVGLDAQARVLLINTEGATDPVRYRTLTGLHPNRPISAAA